MAHTTTNKNSANKRQWEISAKHTIEPQANKYSRKCMAIKADSASNCQNRRYLDVEKQIRKTPRNAIALSMK